MSVTAVSWPDAASPAVHCFWVTRFCMSRRADTSVAGSHLRISASFVVVMEVYSLRERFRSGSLCVASTYTPGARMPPAVLHERYPCFSERPMQHRRRRRCWRTASAWPTRAPCACARALHSAFHRARAHAHGARVHCGMARLTCCVTAPALPASCMHGACTACTAGQAHAGTGMTTVYGYSAGGGSSRHQLTATVTKKATTAQHCRE